MPVPRKRVATMNRPMCHTPFARRSETTFAIPISEPVSSTEPDSPFPGERKALGSVPWTSSRAPRKVGSASANGQEILGIRLEEPLADRGRPLRPARWRTETRCGRTTPPFARALMGAVAPSAAPVRRASSLPPARQTPHACSSGSLADCPADGSACALVIDGSRNNSSTHERTSRRGLPSLLARARSPSASGDRRLCTTGSASCWPREADDDVRIGLKPGGRHSRQRDVTRVSSTAGAHRGTPSASTTAGDPASGRARCTCWAPSFRAGRACHSGVRRVQVKCSDAIIGRSAGAASTRMPP